MYKIFKRFISYLIDLVIISLIVSLLSNNNLINKDLKNYNKYSKQYTEASTEYIKFSNDLSNYYQDNKLEEEEYNKLIENNKKFEKLVNKYYKDNKLSKKNYNKLTKELSKEYGEMYKENYYYINKYSIITNTIYILTIIIYFVLNYILLNNRTLGNRVTDIIIVNNDESKISLKQYLIRNILLYNPLFYILSIVIALTCKANNYHNYLQIASNLNTYLQILIAITIIITKDNRGIHERISDSKIIFKKRQSTMDIIKETKDIIKDTISNKKEDNVEVVKEEKKKKKHKSKKNKKIIIDENKEN